MYIDLNNFRIKKLTKSLRIKKEEKRKYKIASNREELRETLHNYKVAQNNCIQIITEYIAKSVENRLIQ